MKKLTKPVTTIISEKIGDESEERAIARMVSSPEFNGAITQNLMNGAGSPLSEAPSLDAMIQHLESTCKSGDSGEKVLIAQALTLDQLFNCMLQRALGGASSKPIHHLELWLKVALRAQSQCRSTFEAINNIRHPRVQYVSGGHMQVNNTHAQANQNTPNKLKERLSNDLCQNTGTPESPCHTKQGTEAMVEIDRAAHR